MHICLSLQLSYQKLHDLNNFTDFAIVRMVPLLDNNESKLIMLEFDWNENRDLYSRLKSKIPTHIVKAKHKYRRQQQVKPLWQCHTWHNQWQGVLHGQYSPWCEKASPTCPPRHPSQLPPPSHSSKIRLEH
jgi:hypothetical protein